MFFSLQCKCMALCAFVRNDILKRCLNNHFSDNETIVKKMPFVHLDFPGYIKFSLNVECKHSQLHNVSPITENLVPVTT